MTVPFVPRYPNHPWRRRALGVRKCNECTKPAAFGSLKCVQHSDTHQEPHDTK